MERGNGTLVTEFVFLGFSSLAGLQRLLFVAFLPLYLFTLGTNAIIVSTIVLDRALHTPMYFFYDRYVAICNPLRYTELMGHGVCVGLVAAACVCGFTIAQIITSMVFHLPFRTSNQLRHYFCDIAPVLTVASHHSRLSQLVIFMIGVFVLVVPLLLILISYIRIISAILKIPSSTGRYKAFSTCASHLIVVTVHYGCASFIYLRPKSSYSSSQDTLISVSYTILTPLFNPMIYSLRNQEFKSALRRVMGHTSYPIN
ncbi:olfactory receptor 10K1-like [Panthera uncia]|uniref:olfactory receptor 10K1-like n=1 Tax=Panthera uncia TaxID=29064 RepID=UPI0020FFD5A6|nr:olfactory receptor 10K1-like [Panthera uncia]